MIWNKGKSTHRRSTLQKFFSTTRPQKYANMCLAYDYFYSYVGKHNVGNKNNEYFEDDGSDLGLHVQYTCFIWCIIMWSIKIFCPKTIICFIAVLLLRQYSWPLQLLFYSHNEIYTEKDFGSEFMIGKLCYDISTLTNVLTPPSENLSL